MILEIVVICPAIFAHNLTTLQAERLLRWKLGARDSCRDRSLTLKGWRLGKTFITPTLRLELREVWLTYRLWPYVPPVRLRVLLSCQTDLQTHIDPHKIDPCCLWAWAKAVFIFCCIYLRWGPGETALSWFHRRFGRSQ